MDSNNNLIKKDLIVKISNSNNNLNSDPIEIQNNYGVSINMFVETIIPYLVSCSDCMQC